MNDITQRKPVGILLGSYFGIEREIVMHFSLAGYDIYHAPTIQDARAYFEVSDYDFIFCFESFDEESTLDFVYSLSQERFKKVIALVENGKLPYHRRGEGPEISHFFYVRTSPAILQFFIELISGVKSLHMEACSN